MVWKLITLRNSNSHWIDEEAANAYLDRAISLSNWRDTLSPAYVVDRQDFPQQIQAVQNAWIALGTAFRAMDLPPNLSPIYIGGMADAYGFDRAKIPHQNFDVPGLVSIVPSEAGWVTKASAAVVVSSYPLTVDGVRSGQRDYTAQSLADNRSSYIVRMWLTNHGHVKYNCTGDPNVSDSCLTPEGKPYTADAYFTSQGWSIDSTACRTLGDWKCVSWISLRMIFPALIWSLDICRAIATSLKGAKPFEAVDMATKTGFDSPTIFGQQASPPSVSFDLPDDQSVDNTGPGFVRPLPRLDQLPRGPILGPSSDTNPIPRLPRLPGGTTAPSDTPAPGDSTSGTNNGTGAPTPLPSAAAALMELGMSCVQWVDSSGQDKQDLYRTKILAARNAFVTVDELGQKISEIDGYCQMTMNVDMGTGSSGQGGGPKNNSPVPTTAKGILDELGLSFTGGGCSIWVGWTAINKAANIKAAIFDPRGIAATAEQIASLQNLVDSSCGSASTPNTTLPPSGQAALGEMNLTCSQWSKLTADQKNNIYQSMVGARRGVTLDPSQLASGVGQINQFCQSYNNAPPFTLSAMGLTCAQWSKFTPTEKASAVNSAYTQQYKTSIDAASVSQLVATLDRSCVTSGTSNGTGGTGTDNGTGTRTDATGGGINPVNKASLGGGISPTTLLWLALGGGAAYWLYQRSKG